MQASILQKYGEARLPRYTSYPTAPRFSASIGPVAYADWLAGLPHDEPVSLYLHVPFCRSMCWYCGCHTTITGREQPVTDYLGLLREEIRMVATRAPARLGVEKVHFGGGTPTIVKPEEFIALADLLHERFAFTDGAEMAVEIDPRTLSAGMAAALGQAGVARASLGVQSFDPVVQKAINRIQSEECTAEAVHHLRRFGVERINFDLIYGLPNQTVRSCVETVAAAVAMRPDRFAVFGYAHVPTFKKHQRMIDEAALPGSAARSEQARAIAEALTAAGYRQIGLDHFALPDDDLAAAQAAGTLRRNFQGYTTDSCETLIGFGASSIGGPPPARVCPRSQKDRPPAAVIERLMCDFEADVPAICARHGFDAGRLLDGNVRLAMLAGDGVLENDGGLIRVRGAHRFLVRVAAAAFDAYLEESPRTHSKVA